MISVWIKKLAELALYVCVLLHANTWLSSLCVVYVLKLIYTWLANLLITLYTSDHYSTTWCSLKSENRERAYRYCYAHNV